MAKTGLVNISANNTFQVWLDRTNELVDLIGTDVLTASASPGDTTGSVSSPKVATLIGTFTANTITAETRLRTDKIGTTSTDVTIEAPTVINSSQAVGLQSFSSSANPVLRLNNNSVSWDVGFLNAEDFTINNGSGVERLKLTPTGDLTVAGTVAASGFTGNLTGNVTGNVTGDLTGDVTGDLTGDVTGNLTGNVTGNVSGNLTGDVYASNGTTKVLENGNGTTTPATFTGNVTGNVSGQAGTVAALTGLTTTNLAEGTNLYFTNARALSAVRTLRVGEVGTYIFAILQPEDVFGSRTITLGQTVSGSDLLPAAPGGSGGVISVNVDQSIRWAAGTISISPSSVDGGIIAARYGPWPLNGVWQACGASATITRPLAPATLWLRIA